MGQWFQGFKTFLKKVLDKGTHPMISFNRTKGTHPNHRPEERMTTMTIYTAVLSHDGARVAKIEDDGISFHEYFAGYDFMGSVDWTKDPKEAVLMDLEEADQIAEDLTSADM